MMQEADARALLRAWPGLGGIEAWFAEQPWQVTPGGWTVAGTLQGWRFRLEVIDDDLQIIAGEPGVVPARWVVTGRAL
jgi:hypothetical protein